MSADPIVSQKKMPSDDVPRRMMTLLLEMLRSGELADDDQLLIGGAWQCVGQCLTGRPSLASTALEGGIFEIAVAQLNAIGSPADWVTISRGTAGRAGKAMQGPSAVVKGDAAGPGRLRLQRPP